MNAASLLVYELEQLGIRHVFGYPGGAIMPFYDALVGSQLEHVLMRHEQGAALAAGGYARAGGGVGVCVATSGPGATNLLTGVADAYADSVPLLVITGQVPRSLMGTDAFQEVDTFGMTLSVVKHSYVVREPKNISRTIRTAYELARSGRPGPVWIDIPKDVLAADAGTQATDSSVASVPVKPDPVDLQAAEKHFERSVRPLVYVGGGVAAAEAEAALLSFLERHGLPAVTTLRGVGSVPTGHPSLLGMLGMHGSRAANLAVQECDLLLCLGARFDDRATGRLDQFAPEAAVVHVDIDPAELGKLRRANVGLAADVGAFLAAFEPERNPRTEWAAHCADRVTPRQQRPTSRVDAPAFLSALTKSMPGAFVSSDVGQHQMWVAQSCHFRSARQHLSSGGLGTMGFGLPAAIGAAIAQPGRPAIAFCGDGSFLMNVQELTTLRRLDLPVRVVVLDNRMLGLVRQWQDLFFDGRRSEVDLDDNPPFAEVARAFGVPGFELESEADVAAALSRLVESEGPLLCHVHVDSGDGAWPLVPPGAANDVMLDPHP